MTNPIRATGQQQRRSPFAGRPVHELVGLPLKPDAPTSLFDDELWDLHGLAGAPTQLWPATLRFDFTAIRHEPWRWVARELMIALLAPGDDRVALLPLANRDPLAPHTCRNRLFALTGWLNWLTEQGVTSLHDVGQHHCDRYLHHHIRRGLRPAHSSRWRLRSRTGELPGRSHCAPRRLVIRTDPHRRRGGPEGLA